MLYHLSQSAAGLREMKRVTSDGGLVPVVLNPTGTMAELTALVRAPSASGRKPGPTPLSSEEGLALMREEFAQVDVVRYDDKLRVTDSVDLLGCQFSLPIADEPGAMKKLAYRLEDAFRQAAGS